MFLDEPARAGQRDNSRQIFRRVLGVVVACGLTASCSSRSDFGTALGLTELAQAGLPAEQTGSPAGETTESAAADASAQTSQTAAATAEQAAASQTVALAYPTPRPGSVVAEAIESPAAAPVQPVVAAAQPEPQPAQNQTAEAKQPDDTQKVAESAPAQEPAPAKKRGFFASLFGSRPEPASEPAVQKAEGKVEEKVAAPKVAEAAAESPALPPVKLTSFNFESPTAPVQKKIIIDSSAVASAYTANALPGVRANSELFDIIRKSGGSDDSDVDLYEEEGSYQVASATGLARLAPHGLLKQRPDVNTSCFKPGLVRILKAIERHYGKPVIVTSGYRSPEHNRRVRGARKSAHMDCAAADIQVAGVSRWELARFARSLPGRGGVGTYCHTASVHVDVGAERDWNWRCRR